MVSFTKGEGYGRPLCEFTLTGKPIIVSKWSGHTDFLPENYTVYIDGELKEVHTYANQFLLKEAKMVYSKLFRFRSKNYLMCLIIINLILLRGAKSKN